MESNARLKIDDFMRKVHEAVTHLRDKQRSSTPTKAPSMPTGASSLNGDVFVESVGAVVRFHQGNGEHVYTPDAVKMRDNMLGALANSRSRLFQQIARQFQQASRILNIGAGGDVAPIKAMIGAGHEVIATDFAEDTIAVLRERITVPAFACNLLHLNSVLPQPVDYLIGNSTLGYLDPNQARFVLDSVYSSMERGAVFTFDMVPHGSYFNIVEQAERQKVANESAASPYRFLECLEKFGRSDGVNVFAFQEFFYPYAVNLAIVGILRKIFESKGAKCTTGSVHLGSQGGGYAASLVLRVSKGDEQLVSPVDGEMVYDDPDVMLQSSVDSQVNLYSPLLFIDRMSGEALARALGIHQDSRSDPWLVAEYFAKHQNAGSLQGALRQQLSSRISPSQYMERINPYFEGRRAYRPPTALDTVVARDQVLHKLVLANEAPFGPEQADRYIDEAYAERAVAVAEKQRKKEKKQHRQEQKKARKKNK